MDSVQGAFPVVDSADKDRVKTFFRKVLHTEVTDGGTAGTAAAEKVVWRNNTGFTVKLVSCHLATPVAVTADNTNNKVFTLSQRTSAGGSQLTMGTLTTNVAQGSLVAFSPVALTLTAANQIIPAGGVITHAMTVGGTGVAIGAATAPAALDIVIEEVG
jgi:hypothetical protein